MGKIIIKQGDITKEKVDVIVNAANTGLKGGGGVDGAIHRAAGSSVPEECRTVSGCKTGEVVITGAGSLMAKKIIHTPGPVWKSGNKGEAEQLRNCYRNSFQIAADNGLISIAFPAISTGVYGYPLEEATIIALEEGIKWIDKFDEIVFICFSPGDFEVYQRMYKQHFEQRKSG